MVVFYEKDSKKLIDWNGYNPSMLAENFYLPSVYINAIVAAHMNKHHARHELENRFFRIMKRRCPAELKMY